MTRHDRWPQCLARKSLLRLGRPVTEGFENRIERLRAKDPADRPTAATEAVDVLKLIANVGDGTRKD